MARIKLYHANGRLAKAPFRASLWRGMAYYSGTALRAKCKMLRAGGNYRIIFHGGN
jgi:hypothetical protein